MFRDSWIVEQSVNPQNTREPALIIPSMKEKNLNGERYASDGKRQQKKSEHRT